MFKPHWLILLIYVIVLPIIFIGLFSPAFQLISISGCIFLIVLLPYWSNKTEFDLFSPWTFLCLSVFITIFLNSIYVTFDLPNPEYINDYLMGKPKDSIVLSSFYTLIGMLFLTFGYLFQSNNRDIVSLKIFKSDQWSSIRFNLIAIVLMLISWVGLYYYITYAVQGSLIENISAYRKIMSTELSEYRGYGSLMWVVSLAAIVYQMTWVRIISQSNKTSLLHYLLFTLSSVTMISFTIISGVRSGILVWFISLIALTYYIRNRKLSASFKIFFILVFIIAIFVFKFMTDMRVGDVYKNDGDTVFNSFLHSTARVIVSGSGLDISKTGYIIEAIPEKMDFQLGGTFVTILYAWIPREMWPEKPMASLDGIIGMKIYGVDMYGGGGIPPGLIAELYLNFWLFGIPFGCFLLGRLMKKIYVIFKEYRQNRNVIILYVVCFMQLGTILMTSGFVNVLISVLSNGIPLFIVLNVVTNSIKSYRKYETV